MTGAMNHSSSTGAAANSAAGLTNDSITAAPTATTGENHMRFQLVSMSVEERARLDGRHSSRLRRDTSMRQPVRTMASMLNQASYGRNAVCSTAWPNMIFRVLKPLAMCWRQRTSCGFSIRPNKALTKVGRKITDRIAALQNHGDGSSAQHSSSSAVSTGATTLRRRLSNSFQRDSADSGFGSRLPFAAGTLGRSQPVSCQSPRIQRWRRLTSSL